MYTRLYLELNIETLRLSGFEILFDVTLTFQNWLGMGFLETSLIILTVVSFCENS